MKYTILAMATAAGLLSSASQGAPATEAQPKLAISEIAPDRFELVYSGATFSSRDRVERDLLLSSAQLALAHGQQRFVLLALPGEMTDVHPPRRTPGFGAQFGHWQPHWNYYVPEHGWQWWHPEWGGEFWTKDVDPKLIRRFEVHAMIELGDASDDNGSPVFDAKAVVDELGRNAAVPDHSAHHQR